MKRFLTKKFAIEAAIWIAVVVVIFVVIGAVRGPDETETEEPKVAGVSVLLLASSDEVLVPINLSGQIKAKQSTVIRSLVQGTVQSILPVGTQAQAGVPLFRLTNSGIETNYFVALSSFADAQSSASQTALSANSALNQVVLSVAQAEINLELAKQSLVDAEATNELSRIKSEDSVRVAYDSAYSTIESVIRVLGGPNLDGFEFEDVLSNDIEILGDIRNFFDASVIAFESLPREQGSDLLASITELEQTLSVVKDLTSSTWTFLRLGVPGNGYTEAGLSANVTLVSGFITQLNAVDTQVKTFKNALNSTITQNAVTLSNLEKSLQLAEVSFENAQSSLAAQKSNTQLSELGASSQLNAARAQLAAAQFQFENLSLAAPFSGTVISHKTTFGTQLSPGNEIMEIGNLNIVEIRVEVSSSAADAVALGQIVKINGQPVGRISEIEAAADLATGKIGLKIEADNGSNQFVPGSIAEVEFELIYQSSGIFVIPLNSVKVGQTSNTVLVVEGQEAQEKEVILGQVFGDLVEITNGLSEGDMVIVKNGSLLKAGDQIQIEAE